jgi:C-terminal processing protease CtpA/Prc
MFSTIMKVILTFLLLIISVLIDGQSLKVEKLTKSQIDQLFKVGKIWGYLKYYHPDVTKGKYDWDKKLLERIPSILGSASLEESNQIILDWVESLGKTPKQVEYFNTEKVKLYPPIDWIEDQAWLGKSLSFELKSFTNAKRSKKSRYMKVESEGGYAADELVYDDLSYDNKGLLVLSLFRYWNIVEYYYPYRYLTNDWDQVLKKYIPRFYIIDNSLEYKLLIKELAAEINDTHAYVYDDDLDKYFGARGLAIDVRKIDNKFVVYRLLPGFDHEYDIKTGDIITAIDGDQLTNMIVDVQKYIPASNDVIKVFDAIKMALRTNNQFFNIELEDGRTIKVPTHPVNELKFQFLQIESNQILEGNIGYLYIGTVKQGSLEGIFNKFELTKGLIVDLRSYPIYYMVDIFGYISKEVKDMYVGTHGSNSQPGLFTFDPVTAKVSGNPDYYKNKIVVLIDALTISAAESYAMGFKVNPEVIIIGSTTAAADGDIVQITLPGNVITFMTSWGIYYPDGTETQGVGIIPDIEVLPSIKGLKEGRDELVEYAIQLINNGNKRPTTKDKMH